MRYRGMKCSLGWLGLASLMISLMACNDDLAVRADETEGLATLDLGNDVAPPPTVPIDMGPPATTPNNAENAIPDNAADMNVGNMASDRETSDSGNGSGSGQSGSAGNLPSQNGSSSSSDSANRDSDNAANEEAGSGEASCDPRLSCPQRGDMACVGNVVSECRLNINSGCLEWVSGMACAQGRECVRGECVSDSGSGTSQDAGQGQDRCDSSIECSVENERSCFGNILRQCVFDVITNCQTWRELMACPSGQVCQQDACVPDGSMADTGNGASANGGQAGGQACPQDCEEDARQCGSNNISLVVCEADPGRPGCFRWSPDPIFCGADYECDPVTATMVCADSNTPGIDPCDAEGAQRCYTNRQAQICTDVTPNLSDLPDECGQCLEWRTANDGYCAGWQTCEAGECVADSAGGSQDADCGPQFDCAEGETQCISPDMQQTCEVMSPIFDCGFWPTDGSGLFCNCVDGSCTN